MSQTIAENFQLQCFDLGEWRLALTSPRPRPASARPAATLAKAFYPLPSEADYGRSKPRIEGAKPEFLAQLDALTARRGQPPAGGLAVFEDVCSVAGGVLIASSGEIVAESLANNELAARFGPFRRQSDGGLSARVWPLTPIRRHAGNFIFLRQTWDTNYGHWLVELLPRVAVAAQFCDVSQFKFVVSRRSGAMGRVYRDSLAMFGVRPEQIVAVSQRPVLFERLLYPMPVSIHPFTKSPQAIEVLESIPARLGAAREAPRRIYVSRRSGSTRRLVNEAAILDLLKPLGFVDLDPGRMSFAEQARMFAQAETIVGVCGAALTNAAYAPRGVRVLALTTASMQDDFFWDLTDLKDGRFFSLHGEELQPERGVKSDFVVDLKAFKDMLAEFIG